MSYISFVDADSEFKLAGTERAWMGRLFQELACSEPALDNRELVFQLNPIMEWGLEPWCLLARIHGQCEIHAFIHGQDRKGVAAIIRQGLSKGLDWSDEIVWSDGVMWVAEKDSKLMPGAIRTGEGAPRGGSKGYGYWEDLVEWLEAGRSAVVLSYSVCDLWGRQRGGWLRRRFWHWWNVRKLSKWLAIEPAKICEYKFS